MDLRKILIIAILSSSICYCSAQNLIIKLTNGNESVISLSSMPIISFNGDKMIIDSSSATITIKVEDILEYVIDSNDTGIEETLMNSEFSNGRISLKGYPKNTPVSVTALDGRILSKLFVDRNGEALIELDHFSPGIIIIYAAKTKIKVLNK
jgi:hypothetical protein